MQTVEERVVLISSKDEPGESTSAAEDALIRVATVMVEVNRHRPLPANLSPT